MHTFCIYLHVERPTKVLTKPSCTGDYVCAESYRSYEVVSAVIISFPATIALFDLRKRPEDNPKAL